MKRLSTLLIQPVSKLISFLFFMLPFAAAAQQGTAGWYLTDYVFKDGSLQKESLLMGTSSKLKDVISYTGAKGKIEITHKRFDVASGKLLHGVTYEVSWTDPSSLLEPGKNYTVDYELKTKVSNPWKAPQQSVYFNQGLNGVYFTTADGVKYITKDFKAKLTTEKVVAKGSKGQKREIQVNMGSGFSAIYKYEWREGGVPATTAPAVVNKGNKPGWYLINYVFKDGTLQKESLLMGTSSKMKDVISYKGAKGKIDISHNRFDVASGKLLHSLKYEVSWTDPADILEPGMVYSVDFERATTESNPWKAPQQTVNFNQGINGLYFTTTDGIKFINKDLKAKLTLEKPVTKGTKGQKREIQVNIGSGFSAIYKYEWRE
ncbi:MAG TPA: hypothetical protein PLB49_13020 [Chitinophagaceae bacterium]|nr:hypothetical protein [Chitinophagaceae bacterium]HPH32773.1 hypothetical protein [Chitinophagaceae bacterium]